jgi:hypothetical protein
MVLNIERTHGRAFLNKTQLYDTPEDGFSEVETYVGVIQMF